MSLISMEANNENSKSGKWDIWGMFLSSLCIVHCILTPILIIVIPQAIPSWVKAESHYHHLAFLFLIVIAAFSMVAGYRSHKSWPPLIWLIVGIILIGFFTFQFNGNVEYVGTIVGSLMLLRGHYLNRKQCLFCESLDHKPTCCDHQHS